MLSRKINSILSQGSYNHQASCFLLKAGKSSPKEVLSELSASDNGLSQEEADSRLRQYGKNEIAQEKPPPWYIQLISAFINPFIIILVVLGIASFFTDVYMQETSQQEWAKVLIIFTMVLVSGTLRFWQEFRSQKAAEKLRELVQNKALVLRRPSSSENQGGKEARGEWQEIPVAELVPGDIIRLSAGDMIPADVRLLFTDDFFVNQAALTGESMPVEKYADCTASQKDSENFLDLKTLCFMGTNVISGTATAIVVATGNRTYFGSLAKAVVGKREMTSFDKGVNNVSWLLIRFMLVMVPIVFLINGFTKNDWLQAFFFALAIAVGLTPEMLPLVVTANLANGANTMAEKKVIIKKLNAIQNLGAIDVLCTDKTGTLTENRVVLVKYIGVDGNESEKVLRYAYLNSYFQTGLKNLLDQAIVEHMEKNFDFSEERKYHKVDEVPFDFHRRRMSVAVQKGKEEHLLICKGAVEEVLDACTHFDDGKKIRKITRNEQKFAMLMRNNLNKAGLRVLAVAYKKTGRTAYFDYKPKDECGLILVGFMGFLDPPKQSAKGAIETLEKHGVKIKIITGDSEIITRSVCKQVRLKSERVLSGSDISSMSDEKLAKEVESTNVFVKIDPLQKARIVRALRNNGHVVGYMGDGVNDAAALREADVGISVDTAVDIAKESSDIILLEKDLLVLNYGIMQGRTVFGNIMKYLKMTTSSNFGNVFSVLTASAFLPFLPMMPIQLLTQNLLYDFSQLSIPWDRMDEEFLKKPKKWAAEGITRFMLFIGPISSIFDIITFLVLWHVFGANSIEHESLFQAGWFVEGLLSQTLIVHMIRTQKIPFIQSSASPPVLFLTAAIMAIGILLPFTPIGEGIGFAHLPLEYFLILVLILLSYCTLTQLVKTWYIKKFGEWL
ncbi:MAG: magnesium-translocating P-type ATPase [Candidatus Micrarchaeota archaeon]|nr:magnesium-translocating P-type ATPase [Candidatus Micrarchaeota archaeon]